MTLAAPSPARRRVLADVIARPEGRARALATDAALILTGAAVVAVLAQVSVPLWPVPITGQTLAVVVVGAALGARRGALALLAYLVIGLAGLPVFADFTGTVAAVAKPSFGFILGFIGAAFVAGWFAERAWDRKPWLAFVGFVAASAVIAGRGDTVHALARRHRLPVRVVVIDNRGYGIIRQSQQRAGADFCVRKH